MNEIISGSKGSFVIANNATLMDLMHFDCDRMCKQFTEYAHYYFEQMSNAMEKVGFAYYEEAEVVEDCEVE